MKQKREHKRIDILLDKLSEMGFRDRDKNTALLRQWGDDMDTVITQLTAGQGARSSDPSEVGGSTSGGGTSGPAFSPTWVVALSALQWKRRLGAGSFGTVFEVDYRGVRVAAKKMTFTVEGERRQVEEILRREFRALQQLQHPHIVRMHGVVIEEETSVSLVMELSELGSLRRLLTDSPTRVLASEPAQVSILSGVARGMAFLHAQTPPVLHHDLKSANVLLWPDGPMFVAKICDFGMATGTKASTMRSVKGGMGAATLAYKAPEAFDDEFSAASEVYSFGIITWEVLTGKVPWEGCSEAKVTRAMCIKEERPPLDPGAAASPLGQLTQRCWAQEPGARPAFGDIVEELQDVLEAVKQTMASVGGVIQPPPNWEAMSAPWQDVALVPVGVDKPEFEEVSNLFYATCSRGEWHIASIKRVQNLPQLRLYETHKRTIEARKRPHGANEKRLFHGTAKANIPKINRNSFNRRYCGKNATVYGEGVYFAVGAAPWSIRDTYSPSDEQGNKYMYLARVAVGEFCKGDSSMRVPPPQPGSGDLLSYDTTVDNMGQPEMYVAYHDAQAYPEYLITIRRQ